MSEKKAPRLVSQQQALSQYLDSLLMEIPDETPQEILEVVEKEGSVTPPLEMPADASIEAGIDSDHCEIPAWGAQPFKALFFNVGEITLAAPLKKLAGVLTEYDDIKVMPGTSDYYLGVLVHRGNTIRIIDFERLVAESSGEEPPRLTSHPEMPRRIILIEDECIGIACREVGDVEEVCPEEVRWRSGISKRPWYRGIVVEKMCALLDIDTLVAMLNDKNSQR